jgi:prevent-host-death family protein
MNATIEIDGLRKRFGSTQALRAVTSEGPQVITRHGEDIAVVVAIGEYHRPTRPAVDLASILLGGPKLDAATGEPAGGWAVVGDPVNSVAFSPHGALVAAACGEGTVCLLYPLHVLPSERQAVLEGHTGAVYGVAFSPAEPVIASAGQDGTTRLWR